MSEANYLSEDVIAASLCKQYIESAKEWQSKMAQSLKCVPDNESELCERYRRLCQSSHLHIQNIFLSPVYSDKWPNNLEVSRAKGTEVALLALHTNYFFMVSIAKQNEVVFKSVNKFYSQYMRRANHVLKQSRFIKPMEIEFEKI
jgi:hypothetical protein